MSHLSVFKLPEPERRYRFALTPLADVMFQLLIFFMLTSNLVPYALLTLQSAPPAGLAGRAGAAAPDVAVSVTAGSDAALWVVEAGQVSVGGVALELDAIDNLVSGLAESEPFAGILLVLSDSARVQDLAEVLASLERAEINPISIAREAAQ
ncbi:MAG: biopolymer transporter ExbD [Loktanella sp.]|nr:biopolymer transporter ExbD [Loktanella sp.]